MSSRSLALASLLILGCGGSNDVSDTAVGRHVFTSNVIALTLSDGGGSGLGPATPAAAPCSIGMVTYALTVPDRHLTWSRCLVANGGQQASDYTVSTADRILSEAEWQTLVPALEGLVITDNKQCGADKDPVTVSVSTPAGEVDYEDGFYGCDQTHDKPLLSSDSIDTAAQALAGVAHP